MSASNDKKEEAKQLIDYLALTTNNATKLDILTILLQHFGVNRIKYVCVQQHSFLMVGILLKSIDLTLEFMELIGDRLF